MKLDLGAGSKPRQGFTGVDRVRIGTGLQLDLVSGTRWPFPENSVEELSSSHFIEHIPNDELPSGQDRLLWFFDECFRVIKPGGLFHLNWPACASNDAFRDPTHRRFIPLEMLHYLSREGRAAMGVEHYQANCNWISKSVGAHLNPECPTRSPHLVHVLEGLWRDSARLHAWDVVKAYSVILVAEK